jgi:2-aminobenzoate-CoA ligase
MREKRRFHLGSRDVVAGGYDHVVIARGATKIAVLVLAECEERGQIVAAFVVLKPDVSPDEATAMRLQNHVKASIAPYKYPRALRFVEALPKTQTGKFQRFQLRSLS